MSRQSLLQAEGHRVVTVGEIFDALEAGGELTPELAAAIEQRRHLLVADPDATEAVIRRLVEGRPHDHVCATLAVVRSDITDQFRAELCGQMRRADFFLNVLSMRDRRKARCGSPEHVAGAETCRTIWQVAHQTAEKLEAGESLEVDDHTPQTWRFVAHQAAWHPNSPDGITIRELLGAENLQAWTSRTAEAGRRPAARRMGRKPRRTHHPDRNPLRTQGWASGAGEQKTAEKGLTAAGTSAGVEGAGQRNIRQRHRAPLR